MPTAEAALTIGTLAARTGCTVATIRYYEEIGLIPAASRRPSGHRVYGGAAQQQLTFIRHCRDFGFSIDQVRELVSLATSKERDCVETRVIAQAHLDAVRVKLGELQALEASLVRFVDACTTSCAGGPAVDCTILKDLMLPDAPAQRGCCG
ncbi:MerR family transcriptional regulator [Gloeobacter kilaueensis]|uniref:MerR family transcriptional regulator n=1 Tax=Gloeobacter kilaueensis (strain ATCC BAA-2537 / CCAP 1431/1 / ULC 316 / JS1) TaxID=1183438 RepID=U5QK10_GLOK1|nr:helix-turn-helix domain-containing protein [Gloeobacter kilaueensis]AGY57944.1 MerR family transcriptional regulator [Gloeobacter kilaueensis JS1]